MSRLPDWLAAVYAEIGRQPDVRPGKKHRKVYVDGRFVGIISQCGDGSSDHRTVKNTISNVRKAARGLPTRRG